MPSSFIATERKPPLLLHRRDAIQRKEALMSENEKKINRRLLEKVEEYKALNNIA